MLTSAVWAWACTGQSGIQLTPTISPPEGRVALSQTASGAGFAPASAVGTEAGSGPVQIRWNSMSGPLLATVAVQQGQSLATEIAIPRVAPGVYYVVASQGSHIARAAVQVSGGHGANASGGSADLWGGFSTAKSSAAAADSAVAPASSPTSAAVAGLGLLAGGAAALGAFGIMTFGSRRRTKRNAG